MVQVVALVHSDLHDDQTLNTINFLASSLLWITLDKEEKGKKNYFDQRNNTFLKLLFNPLTPKM